MRFIEGPPAFAIEVRSEGDDGPSAEAAMATRRADAFEASIRVVWDADPIGETIRVLRRYAPEAPAEYRTGEVAEAEDVLNGWRLVIA